MDKSADLLPGTLDLLILKAVSLGPRHGYGVLLRIEQISGGSFHIEQGALYPATPPTRSCERPWCCSSPSTRRRASSGLAARATLATMSSFPSGRASFRFAW